VKNPQAVNWTFRWSSCSENCWSWRTQNVAILKLQKLSGVIKELAHSWSSRVGRKSVRLQIWGDFEYLNSWYNLHFYDVTCSLRATSFVFPSNLCTTIAVRFIWKVIWRIYLEAYCKGFVIWSGQQIVEDNGLNINGKNCVYVCVCVCVCVCVNLMQSFLMYYFV
jgi:hypothetical protein